jgi:fused signal recognition particle receptor
MMVFDRFKRLDESVRRTRESFFGKVSDLFDRRQIDESLWDELEELMIQADVGVDTTFKLIERTRERVKREHIREAGDAKIALKSVMVELLKMAPGDSEFNLLSDQMNIILIVGVNGTGKTTSIAKLAQYLSQRGKKVVLAAGDTFRAAAIEQLKIWGERTGVPVVAHAPDSDPGAVVFDALQAGAARKADAVVIDTAGRLHTKFNLMEELKKIRRVITKVDPTGPHQVLLVLDATTGQNALLQAKHFTEAVGVTGVILAKLDGTARGGMAFAIADEMHLPIKFVGTGEKPQDLAEFDPEEFVNALLG